MQPFPHPNDATHKIWSRLTNWLQRYSRYSSSKVWNFRHSRASNSKMSGLIWPKIEFDQVFMSVLVTSNFDDDSIKNERASMETPYSHYKSMGNFLDAQGQLTLKSVVRSGRNLNLFEILCMSSLRASIKRIGSKATKKRWRHHFPHYKSMGAFCCHRHQSFGPICLKTLCSLPPPPVMLHIKFDQDWPIGLRDIQVRKCNIFHHSRASNSKVSSLIRPQIKLMRAFMPVLVTSNFDDDLIKNERASMQTAFFHYNLWEMF